MLTRIQQLSGQNPAQFSIQALQEHKQILNKDFDNAIETLKKDPTINEGLFSNLKAALATANKVTKVGASVISDAARKVSASIKEMYKDAKAQGELKKVITGLQTSIANFDKIANDAPTILERDTEVAKEMQLFRQLFEKTIATLQSRVALAEGFYDTISINKMIVEMKTTQEALSTEIKETK